MGNFIVLNAGSGIGDAGIRLLGGRRRHALLSMTLFADAYQLQIVIVDLLVVETKPDAASVRRQAYVLVPFAVINIVLLVVLMNGRVLLEHLRLLMVLAVGYVLRLLHALSQILIRQVQVIITLALEHDGATHLKVLLEQQIHARQRLVNLLLQCLF